MESCGNLISDMNVCNMISFKSKTFWNKQKNLQNAKYRVNTIQNYIEPNIKTSTFFSEHSNSCQQNLIAGL